jgi:hypothetical protein
MKTLRMNVGSLATTKLQSRMRSILPVMAIAIVTLALAIIGCKHDEPTPIPSVTIGGRTIPVYKGAGVSDADFNTTFENLKAAIPALNTGIPAKVANNTDKIEIGGTGITLNARVLMIEALSTKNGIGGTIESIYYASL